MSKDELSQFPTLEEAKEIIRNLGSKKWASRQNSESVADYSERVRKEMHSAFKGWLSVFLPSQASELNLPLFRTRPMDEIVNSDAISEYSYSPICVTTKPGRCHFPDHPVFYCSLNAATSLLEAYYSCKKRTQRFCIGKWGVHRNDWRIIIQYFTLLNLPKKNSLHLLSSPFEEQLKKSLNGELSDSQIKGTKVIFEYLHNLFVSESNFELTAVLAHLGLYADHNFRTDILLYPSVAASLTGANAAIQPNFVDNNMFLEYVYMLNLDSFDQKTGRFQVSLLRYGEVEKNVLLWKDHDNNNSSYMKRLEDDFGPLST